MIWIVVAGLVGLLALGLVASFALGGFLQLGLAGVLVVVVLLATLVRFIRRKASI